MKNFGETLKKLRKQKDMTQEQLAEYLNISPQAVSRWEINSTLPDITLVPMLANIFDVTTDMLLGVDIDAKEKRINEITQEADNYFWKKQNGEAEKVLRAGLKEYPNSYILMDKLVSVISSFISGYDVRWGEEEKKAFDEEKKPVREEIIALSEKTLAECTDDNIRHSSIKRLCSTYASMGETKKAKSFANKMPDKAYARENLITETLKGTEKYKHIQKQLVNSIFYDVLNSIIWLMITPLDDGSKPFNPDEEIALHHKTIDIINIFIEKGSFGDFNFRLAPAHLELAILYSQKNDAAAALKHFKLAAKHAIPYDAMPPVNDDSREEYTSLLFKGIKFPFNMVCSTDTMTEQLLERSRELDSHLPASELEEIRNELRKHTKIN